MGSKEKRDPTDRGMEKKNEQGRKKRGIIKK